MPGVYGDGQPVTGPRPVAGGPAGRLLAGGQARPAAPVRRGWRHDGGRGRGRPTSPVHEEEPQSVLLHAGLVAGGRGAVLELLVHHAGVRVGGRHRAAGVGGPGEEPAVAVVLVRGEAQHGPAGGAVLGGEAPGNAGDCDEDDTNSCNRRE